MRFNKASPEDSDYPRSVYPHCVICGCPVLRDKFSHHEMRPDWSREIGNRRGRCAYTSTADVEATDLSEKRLLWSAWYRALLLNPKLNGTHLSGLACGANREYAPVVPTDSSRARLSGRPKHDNDWNTEFYPTPLFQGESATEWEGKQYGYAMHAHCWLLLERNLEVFCIALRILWNFREYTFNWQVLLKHGTNNECFDQGIFGVRKMEFVGGDRSTGGHPDRSSEWPLEPWHTSGSPYAVREIQTVISNATQSAATRIPKARLCRKPPFTTAQSQSLVTQLPLDIILEILDVIYYSSPPCFARINDTRNILEAFHWHVPDTYWIKRCNPYLIIEVKDLRASGTPVHWANLCLGIEGLFIDPNWYCQSGLRKRKEILEFVGQLGGYMRHITTDEMWVEYLATQSGIVLEREDCGWREGWKRGEDFEYKVEELRAPGTV
ncbi:hypothetical protein BJX65DRAFT_302048 [Aspergillus insuetus]